PAVARLVPDAYPDDAHAGREFRHATEHELLDRRRDDANRVLSDLKASGASGADGADDAVVDVALSPDDARAWMRSLAALRLIIASRLGVADEDDHDPDDPRFGVYDWLGYRLDGLVHAVSADAPTGDLEDVRGKAARIDTSQERLLPRDPPIPDPTAG